MRPAAQKTIPALRTAFVAAERRLRSNRGIGVPQGLANNLEDLQRALDGLTKATALERTNAAASIAQNEQLQATINTLQQQMSNVVQGGATGNAVQTQQPPAQMLVPPQQGIWHLPNMNMGQGGANVYGAPAQQW